MKPRYLPRWLTRTHTTAPALCVACIAASIHHPRRPTTPAYPRPPSPTSSVTPKPSSTTPKLYSHHDRLRHNRDLNDWIHGMSKLVPSSDIERIVGVPRHRSVHYGRASSTEQVVY